MDRCRRPPLREPRELNSRTATWRSATVTPCIALLYSHANTKVILIMNNLALDLLKIFCCEFNCTNSPSQVMLITMYLYSTHGLVL